MNPKAFFGELKGRNVYKVAVAYVAARAMMNRAASQAAPKEPAAPAPMPPYKKLGQSYSSAKDLSQGDKDDLHPHANSRSK